MYTACMKCCKSNTHAIGIYCVRSKLIRIPPPHVALPCMPLPLLEKLPVAEAACLLRLVAAPDATDAVLGVCGTCTRRDGALPIALEPSACIWPAPEGTEKLVCLLATRLLELISWAIACGEKLSCRAEATWLACASLLVGLGCGLSLLGLRARTDPASYGDAGRLEDPPIRGACSCAGDEAAACIGEVKG